MLIYPSMDIHLPIKKEKIYITKQFWMLVMKVQKNHVEQRNVDHTCHLCCLTCYYNSVKYKLIFWTFLLKGVKCGSICTFGRSRIDSMIGKICMLRDIERRWKHYIYNSKSNAPTLNFFHLCFCDLRNLCTWSMYIIIWRSHVIICCY